MKGVDVYPILLDILANPGSPQPYRKLKTYYETTGMINEAKAVGYLLEKRFGENATSPDDSSNSRRQGSDEGYRDSPPT